MKADENLIYVFVKETIVKSQNNTKWYVIQQKSLDPYEFENIDGLARQMLDISVINDAYKTQTYFSYRIPENMGELEINPNFNVSSVECIDLNRNRPLNDLEQNEVYNELRYLKEDEETVTELKALYDNTKNHITFCEEHS